MLSTQERSVLSSVWAQGAASQETPVWCRPCVLFTPTVSDAPQRLPRPYGRLADSKHWGFLKGPPRICGGIRLRQCLMELQRSPHLVLPRVPASTYLRSRPEACILPIFSHGFSHVLHAPRGRGHGDLLPSSTPGLGEPLNRAKQSNWPPKEKPRRGEWQPEQPS